ncbi:uncharacterized protein RJT21DRAFT_121554 [Scheffersomyces amazonensis]|uniref:uncharacterized protein n=1 Tax=Scheffersomyces amazonensis TaxID=1078765 RepID=UPI00315C7DCF
MNQDDYTLSSSDDESQPTQPHSNIRLPHLNLHDYRRHQQKQASRNFSKASKKLATGGKSVRFPDSYVPRNPRDSMISSGAASNASSLDEELEDFNDQDNVDPHDKLPSFKFNTSNVKHSQSELNDNESDENNVFRNQDIEYDSEGIPQSLSDSSSSDDDDDEDNNEDDKGKGEGIDITDQNNSSQIKHSSSSSDSYNEERKKSIAGNSGGLKGILRKMSLIDRPTDQDMSPSDTFLGRVLSMSNGGGLSGGGLAPGASRMEHESIRENDEEARVGFDDSIEMKPMDFDSLSEEAKQLIQAHVPESRNHIHEGSSSSHNTTSPTDSGGSHRSSDHKFYTPLPGADILNNDYYEPTGGEFLLDGETEDGYIAPPSRVHAGVLSSLLKLYNHEDQSRSTSSLASSRFTDAATLAGESTFGESINETRTQSSLDFNKLKQGIRSAPKKVESFLGAGKHKHTSSTEDDEDQLPFESEKLPSFQNAKPRQPPKRPPKLKKLKGNRREQKLKITVHIADILQRQRFIMQLCRALMLFGAPTHRLEEYMLMTSRVLEIDGQFMYFPGCMIVSFGDAATRTSEVHLVRCVQGLNLSKLSDAHKIYKGVIHDIMGVDIAAAKLDELLKKKNLYPPWMCVLYFGLGAATVAPFAFGGGWLDVPICFGVGCCVGFLQFYLSSMSNLYSSVFEVTASIVVSFIARGIGSIRGGNLFCFAAIVQGSLALILPGYIILCGSLELQSRNIVAGSVRMFYAIIYSLFLGFGITLGAALYGWVDSNATSANTCSANHSLNDKWRILFVPGFSLSLALINQARWQQIPIMLAISGGGYVASYFAGKHFANVTEFTSCIGAFIIGILGNLYSRVWRGMAVSAMLPAVFVQVPSGIASKGSLISGVNTADQITKGNSTAAAAAAASGDVDMGSLSFGATMVQVSIGISVGLFAAALVVYPFGKKRTGLFTL